MISRHLVNRLINHSRLNKFRQMERFVQPKRFAGHHHHEDKWDDPHPPLQYRNIGDFQDTSDWIGCVVLVSFFVATSSINIYMNWDELKPEDPPGFNYDNTRFTDQELGIPSSDELGYAPIKPDLLSGERKLLDLGYTLRGERRQVHHAYMVRAGKQSPYDN